MSKKTASKPVFELHLYLKTGETVRLKCRHPLFATGNEMDYGNFLDLFRTTGAITGVSAVADSCAKWISVPWDSVSYSALVEF